MKTAIKYESEWEVNLKIITYEYIKQNFWLDFLACFPGLLTGEQVLWLYPFKVLRVSRISRIITFLKQLSGLLKERFMLHQIMIVNYYMMMETIFILVFCLHILVCCFIAIGHVAESQSIQASWLVRLGLFDEPDSAFHIYWTGWYFVTTSITTVGYGEISGTSWPEKFFIILLLFIGILLFTLIQTRTRQTI